MMISITTTKLTRLATSTYTAAVAASSLCILAVQMRYQLLRNLPAAGGQVRVRVLAIVYIGTWL